MVSSTLLYTKVVFCLFARKRHLVVALAVTLSVLGHLALSIVGNPTHLACTEFPALLHLLHILLIERIHTQPLTLLKNESIHTLRIPYMMDGAT